MACVVKPQPYSTSTSSKVRDFRYAERNALRKVCVYSKVTLSSSCVASTCVVRCTPTWFHTNFDEPQAFSCRSKFIFSDVRNFNC